tara:strand:- start:467 stop:748 length:282 start_codon:yes stop_codon:yes gene_type:complete
MKTKKIDAEQAYELIKKQNNLIFEVKFEKKDGSIRDMNARLNVKKHLKGGTLTYDPSSKGYIIAFDMQKKQYRTINTNTLISLKAKGDTYLVN